MSTALRVLKKLIILGAVAASLLSPLDSSWAQSAARQAGYLYLSPVPGASYVSDQTRYILVRLAQVSPSAITNLTTSFIAVTGAQSGPHPGTAHVASDGRTIIFETEVDFAGNELATVTLTPQLASGSSLLQPFQYQFAVTEPMPGSFPLVAVPGPSATKPPQVAKQESSKARITAGAATGSRSPKAMLMPNGVSVPSDFPTVVITANSNPSPGYLFLENALDGVSPYTMMLDNNGLPVWYQRGRMFDFKIQKTGLITSGGYDNSGAVIFSGVDQNFNPVRIFSCTNGYSTDVHDLKVLPNGNYVLIGNRINVVQLGLYIAGWGTLPVTETVVQEYTASDELILQWRAWDNYDIRDLVPTGNSDFAHMNGVDIDDDGNLLVSARHLSEVTKIDRDTGEIIWRLGGAHSSFTFTNDPFNGTSYQHNISALGNGHYMVFDNGDYHSPQISRAVEYQLDLTNMTANLVWQFRDSPDKYAWYCGSAQRLPTGNTFIDFVIAGYPKATEVDQAGVKRFELSLVPSSDSYRAFRFPWTGVTPAPYLIVEPQPDNVTLVFNKFGDTNVAYYRIYGGSTPHPTTLMAESDTPLKALANLRNGLYYFRVTAVSTSGEESPFSNEESLNVNIVQAGQSVVQNGGFSQGTNSWAFNMLGTANAVWTVSYGASQIYITNGGTTLASIQLLQPDIPLISGQQYVFQFDASATPSRYIEAQVAQAVSPFFNYSGSGNTFLTPNIVHYKYAFTMQQPSDSAANLLFDLGTTAGTVSLANVSLSRSIVGDLNSDGRVDALDLSILFGNWLKQQSGLPGDLDGNNTVDFNDFNALGQNWGVGGP